MPDVTSLERSLASCAVRAGMASRVGDEVARDQALAEADAIGRLLDKLAAEAEWNTLADNRHG